MRITVRSVPRCHRASISQLNRYSDASEYHVTSLGVKDLDFVSEFQGMLLLRRICVTVGVFFLVSSFPGGAGKALGLTTIELVNGGHIRVEILTEKAN